MLDNTDETLKGFIKSVKSNTSCFLLAFDLLFILFMIAICWERAVPLGFRFVVLILVPL